MAKKESILSVEKISFSKTDKNDVFCDNRKNIKIRTRIVGTCENYIMQQMIKLQDQTIKLIMTNNSKK